MMPRPATLVATLALLALQPLPALGQRETAPSKGLILRIVKSCGEFAQWDGPACARVCRRDLPQGRELPWCDLLCDTEEKFEEEGSGCPEKYCGDDRQLADVMPFCADNRPGGGVTVRRDVTYMRAYGVDFKLDVYLDEEVEEDLPLVVFVHGGSFIGGSKGKKNNGQGERFVRMGYRYADIDYPLCRHYWDGTTGTMLSWDDEVGIDPSVRNPDCSNSVALAASDMPASAHAARIEIANRSLRSAVQYLHRPDVAQDLRIDTSRTACYGTSAGAITCFDAFLFNTTVIGDPDAYHALVPDPDLDAIAINVATGRSGAYFPAKANITDATVAAMPPGAALWNIIGTEDETVPPELAVLMSETLTDYDITNELTLVEGAGHGGFFTAADEEELLDFIAENLAIVP